MAKSRIIVEKRIEVGVLMSIYESIGGAGSIATAIDRFYERVLADPDLAPYFDNVNIAQLKNHQRAFFTAALGGAGEYKGRNMRSAHADLGVSTEDFEKVVGYLVETLQELGVDAATIATIGETLAPLKSEIVEED